MSLGSRLLSIGLLAFSIACGAERGSPPGLSSEDSTALRQLAARDAEWVRARDWATLVALYEDNAVRMPPNAPAFHGRAANRAFLDRFPPITSFAFRAVDFGGQGGLAYMHGAWSISLAPPGGQAVTDSGKILIVYRKQPDGSWLRIADAWNSDLPSSR